jgi:hypothetical protein
MIVAATQSTTRQNGGHHRVFRNEMTSVPPEILEPVARQAENEQPWRLRDGRGGDDDEDRCDICLEGDNEPTSIGNREADVDGRDQYQTQGVHGRRIEPPKGERRRCLDSTPDEPPHDRRAYLPTLFMRFKSPTNWGISHGSTSNPERNLSFG